MFEIKNGMLISYTEEEGITSVVIPDSVKNIGEFAFDSCTGLTSITIPESVTSINSYAFINCCSLTSITIPNSVTNIGNYAFFNCSSLASVTLGNSVTSIGHCAFEGCSSLTSITLPNSVTSIGGDAFAYCTNLTSITISDSVTKIGSWAFFLNKNLKTKKANYKAFDFKTRKLKCRGLKYQEGKWSKNIDEIKICERGYHFCDNLFAIFNYYSGEIDKDIVIYECEVGDKIETDGIKCVTNKIKPVKRLYRKDIIKILNNIN